MLILLKTYTTCFGKFVQSHNTLCSCSKYFEEDKDENKSWKKKKKSKNVSCHEMNPFLPFAAINNNAQFIMMRIETVFILTSGWIEL